MSITDRRGVPLTASDPAAAAAYDDALEAFLNYELAAGAMTKQVLTDHPDMVMASVLRGSMMMMLETSGVHPKVASMAADGLAGAEQPTARERLHLEALGRWAAGDVLGAADAWDRILVAEPLDVLALKLHHYTTFWTGRASVLASAVDGVIDAWDPDVPGYDHVLGMQAFALNETGRHVEAEAAGREAVARNGEDLWSIHAVAHALEMQCAHRAGRDFLSEAGGYDVAADGAETLWGTKNPFIGHVWWHAALFEWHGGDYDRVLDLYDRRVRPSSTEFYLDLQNLSSLLARLERVGVDVGDRWDELADHAAGRIGDHVLTFTDVHVALTLARTGRRTELAAFIESLAVHRAERAAALDAAPAGRAATALLGHDVAIQVAQALDELGAGSTSAGVERLLAIRGDLAPIGGSHAQRDLFDLILAEGAAEAGAASGDVTLAVNLYRARARRWPRSVPTWHRLGELLGADGQVDPAAEATTRAMEVAMS